MPESKYVLGDDDDELKRLKVQHELWRKETKQLLARAGFSKGQKLLDVGCGPGFTTFELLEIVGKAGQVLAVDSSEKMIGVLQKRLAANNISNATGICQNVEELSSQLGKIDGAFARWLLCFLPDPAAAVSGTAALLKAGGKLAIMDYFNYRGITVEPSSSVFDRAFQAVFDSFENGGGGLEVGRRVPGLMESAGLQVESIESICRVGRPGTQVWQWVSGFQQIYFPQLVEQGYLTKADLDEFNQFWTQVSKRSDAFFFAPPILGVIGVKG